MSEPAIQTWKLGKRYRLRVSRAASASLRDAVASSLRTAVATAARLVGGRPRSERPGDVWALRGVDLTVREGEIVGIIGRNGSGKSTLLKVLSRITEPTEGTAAVGGRVGALLEVGTGFHPELTGRENIFLSGTILGMKRREVAASFDEIVAFSGLEQFVDSPVKFYSTGMYLRLAFSVAAHLRADILLIDEVLAVGDAEFEKRCLQKMSALAGSGRTVLFVSHNIVAVSNLCERGVVLDRGLVVAEGPVEEAVAAYHRLIEHRCDDDTGPDAGEWVRVVGPEVVGGSESMAAGEPWTLRFRIRLERPVWHLLVQLGLGTAAGSPLVLDYRDSDAYPRLRTAGEHVIEVTIPALWLRSGLYSARVKVHVQEEVGESQRFLSETLALPVTAELPSDYHSAISLLLAPRCEWSLTGSWPAGPRVAG